MVCTHWCISVVRLLPLSPGPLTPHSLPLSYMAMQPSIKTSTPLTVFLPAGDAFLPPVHLADNSSYFRAHCDSFLCALRNSADASLTLREWNSPSAVSPLGPVPGSRIQHPTRALGDRAGGLSGHPIRPQERGGPIRPRERGEGRGEGPGASLQLEAWYGRPGHMSSQGTRVTKHSGEGWVPSAGEAELSS